MASSSHPCEKEEEEEEEIDSHDEFLNFIKRITILSLIRKRWNILVPLKNPKVHFLLIFFLLFNSFF